MRILLALLLITLVLTSCSWAEFTAGLSKVKDSIRAPGNQTTTTKNMTTPNDDACTTDLCIREKIRSCAPAQGTLLLLNATINVSVVKTARCTVQGVVIASPDDKDLERTLSCELPLDRLELLPEVFIEPTLGYCGGSWYERIPIQVAHDGPIDLPRIAVNGNEVMFNITPQQHLYLRSVIIGGSSFRNCTLHYKTPIKLVKDEKMPLAISCASIVGKSPRPEGTMAMTYYVNPDFRNASEILVTFTAAR